mgnify:CR=1 FL=1
MHLRREIAAFERTLLDLLGTKRRSLICSWASMDLSVGPPALSYLLSTIVHLHCLGRTAKSISTESHAAYSHKPVGNWGIFDVLPSC